MMSAFWPRPEGDGLEPRVCFPLARQSSISSMTFDELQDSLGKDVRSMNMDELFGNIWTAEETQSMVSACGSAQGGAPSENVNLQQEGSLTLPRPTSQKTVDEVWKDIINGYGVGGGGGGDKDGRCNSGSQLMQRQPSLGEMTLEEFLVRAGVVREEARPEFPVGICVLGSTGEREMEGGRRNKRTTGFGIAVTSEDSSQVQGMTVEETQAMASVCGSAQGERGNKKTTGVRIAINLEDISQVQGMTVEHAARHLNVSRSTFKRACREHDIERWPPRKGHKLSSQSRPNESPVVIVQELISQLNSDMLLPSNQFSATRNTNSVTVKARYGKETIKFRLSWPWGTAELKQQVEKRLEHKDGTYFIRYKDEANEMILIACDEDLQDCISSSSPQGTGLIEVFLESK